MNIPEEGGNEADPSLETLLTLRWPVRGERRGSFLLLCAVDIDRRRRIRGDRRESLQQSHGAPTLRLRRLRGEQLDPLERDGERRE